MASIKGYYRYPAISKNNLVFVSEDDLWSVSLHDNSMHASEGQDYLARRLTSNRGFATTPVFSPDGSMVAFAGADEGMLEVYTISLDCGKMQRLTYLGESVMVCSWVGEYIYFSAPSGRCLRVSTLWRIHQNGGVAEDLNLGPVQNISFAPDGKRSVIQRHGYREYGFWKRYRGGTAGQIWIDLQGDGVFTRLLSMNSNFSKPLWIGERIYFISDHDGVGNIYSCSTSGDDIKQYTFHKDFYVRNQSTDGKSIVYHCGGEIYKLDINNLSVVRIDVFCGSPRMQVQRKLLHSPGVNYLALHDKGQCIVSSHRGKLRVYNGFEGPVLPLGDSDADDIVEIRYRNCVWLKDGKRIIASANDGHEDYFLIFDGLSGAPLSRLDASMGLITNMLANPCHNVVAVLNNRGDVYIVDIESGNIKLIDTSKFEPIHGIDWSADGMWLAYDCSIDRRRTAIKIVNLNGDESYQVTNPVLKDQYPSFDPEGKFLYFLSSREFAPTHDSLHFDLGFMAGMRPYMLTLKADAANPFVSGYSLASDMDSCVDEDDSDDGDSDGSKADDSSKKEEKISPVEIDFDNIKNRIIALPIEPGQFSHLIAIKGKIVYLSHGLVNTGYDDGEDSIDVALEVFDLDSKKTEEFVDGVRSFYTSNNRKFMAYECKDGKIRIVKCLEKADDSPDCPPKKSGFVDTSRISIMADPSKEWRQIYMEAWRLQKEHFWVEDMSEVDWDAVYHKYEALLSRISSRRELSDLLWEMQGELGVSHAYVVGGDVKPLPRWPIGFLGARFSYDDNESAYKIDDISYGDLWHMKSASPLASVGACLNNGDFIYAVDGVGVDRNKPIESLLVGKSSQEVMLTCKRAGCDDLINVYVKTIASQHEAEYRDWVNSNRAYVHEKTNGSVGYIHIPDMSDDGYAEFHRGFFAECDRYGLIIDVRFNGGGSVSPLILEKLSRKRMGYDLSRWQGLIPYPVDASHGRLVAITNEYAGSDGDMFSSMFKAMNLGPLIGKRTWGGVIGINPRHSLIDHGYTTQPEYSFWSYSEGWGMENYGVDPDVEVEIAPQDYKNKKDPQLDEAIAQVLSILEASPVVMPDLSNKPSRRGAI